MTVVKDDSEANGSSKPRKDEGAQRELEIRNKPENEDRDANDDEEDDDDDEPRLKYSRLTERLASVYRNGDSTSAFMVTGDKMVMGTHNGNIHVCNVPIFQSLRTYRAHSASVTSVSVSPFPSPFPNSKAEVISRPPPEAPSTPKKATTSEGPTSSPRTPKEIPLPATPSNSIHIATSSIDGYVCVFSLVDRKDVIKRNFSRPVQSVALSPDYKNDRTFLSGGLAGSLILTVGGEVGASSNANTNSAAAAASGWLGSIGLGSSTGKDSVLHSGEGMVGAIKWSLSGKFVIWVNEQGMWIMRSNLKLESADSEFAWRRIGHVDKPNRRIWEDMAGVWKPRIEWVDDQNLEQDEEITSVVPETKETGKPTQGQNKNGTKTTIKKKFEKVVVGWGDTAWVIHVIPGGTGVGKHAGERTAGSADIINILRFEDCILAGLSLYTPSLLLVLAYRTRNDDAKPQEQSASQNSPRRGRSHRQNGLSPELRLINAISSDEVEVDTLTVSRFESLSAADYHLSTLYVPPPKGIQIAQRGALGAIGGGIWDAGVNATRLFSSAASVFTVSSGGAENKVGTSQGSGSGVAAAIPFRRGPEMHPAASSVGLKVFIQSPYDCVLAIKRDLGDHLSWLLDHESFAEAYELLEDHPEVVAPAVDQQADSTPISSPSRTGQSLADFFADDTTSEKTMSIGRIHNSSVNKEKRRIGDQWVQQLVTANDWQAAGKVAGRVLGTSDRWEHWVFTFAAANKFDEISPYIPSKPLKPPLSPTVYEQILGHYIVVDRLRFRDLLDQWDADLFNVDTIVVAIRDRLSAGDIKEGSVEEGEQGRDWRVLNECLAKLYIADSRLKEALHSYIRLRDGDAAMGLIRQNHHLLEAVRDDIPGFVLLRVSKEQMLSSPLTDLEETSSEAVRLLVDEAHQGVIRPDDVVSQLKRKGKAMQPYLFFYLRALWKGQGSETDFGSGADRTATEGRSLVEDFGDLAVDLFAEYDRSLLMEFLKSSQSYSFEKASAVCESRQYIPELVYLLSKTGQTKRALHLIISSLGDVSLAISFAKEQDDPDLWSDLLSYSMDKPPFIRALLEQVGTAINPIDLVRRIPEGLEIEGLREGIGRIVREHEIQYSIAEGVARVLRGEVAAAMDTLRNGQKRAVKFDVVHHRVPRSERVELHAGEPAGGKTPAEVRNRDPQQLKRDEQKHQQQIATREKTASSSLPADNPSTRQADDEVAEDGSAAKTRRRVRPGHCAVCARVFAEEEPDTLIGFACGHVYHLSCLLDRNPSASGLQASGAGGESGDGGGEDSGGAMGGSSVWEGGYSSRSVWPKVSHAHIIRSALRGGGCAICRAAEGEEE